MTAPLLETARLRCRRWRRDDFDALYAVYSDPVAMRWVDDGQPISREACAEWLSVTENNYRARGYGMFALEDRASGEVIGFCGLVHPGGQAEAEIKYAFLRSHWGRGLASEIVPALLAHGAAAHGLQRVIATVAPDNAASQRVLAKAGMTLDHVRRNDDGSHTHVYHWLALPRRFPGGALRRLHARDLGAFQAYRAIPELGRYQGWSPMTDEAARAFLAEMAAAPLLRPGEWIQLGIAGADDGDRLVGDVGLHLSADASEAEVGFTLAPAAQGRGLATAAVREVVALAFSASTVRRVQGVTDARNGASVRLLQRLGFQLEGTRESVFRGQPCVEQVHVLHRAA